MPDLPLMMSSLLRADLIAAVKNWRALIAPVLMALILLESTRSRQAGQPFGGDAADVGMVTVYALMTTSILGYALMMGRDREAGVLRRLRVTPAPGWAIIASRLTAQAITGLALALVIVLIGARIDSLTPSVAQYGLVVAFSVLGSAVFLSIGQALVGLIGSAATVNAAGRAVFVVLAVLGLVGQSSELGGPLTFTGGLATRCGRRW
jgi:ABC-2 type transport system permease protein